jgi:glycopeptide antibiotics resistance protein
MNQAKPCSPMMLLLPLLGLALALFPLGWLAQVWQPFGRLVDGLFPTAWAHAIGHASLFCLLGLLLAAIPTQRRRPWFYLGILLLAGIGQETFQMLYKGRLQRFDSARDIATDLLGGLLALGLAQGWARWQRREIRD